MASGDVRLTDVLDVAILQRVLDSVVDATAVPLMLVDDEGVLVIGEDSLAASKASKKNFGQQRSGLVADLCRQCRQTGRHVILPSNHARLAVGAAPLIFDGTLLGCWIVGQVRLAEDDETAKPSRGTTGRKSKRERAVSWEWLEEHCTLLQSLSVELLQLGASGMVLAQTNETLTELTQRLKRTTGMMRKFIDSTDIGIYISDFKTGELLMVNERYTKEGGMPIEKLLGQKCWKFPGRPNQETFCEHCPREFLLDADGKPKEPYTWEWKVPQVDSWLRCTNQAIYWTDGRLAHMVTYIDVTAEHKLQENLAKLAFYDKQMSLPNGLKLARDLRETAHDDSQEEAGHLVCFDITSLRRINDAYGRDAADALLRHIALWLRQFGEKSALYRIEGGTFALYLRGQNITQSKKVARDVYDRFAEPWTVESSGKSFRIHCGASVSVVKALASYGDSILDFIRRTLDASRTEGRVAVYDKKMDREFKKSVQLQMELKDCVENGMQGFSVHYQPIVSPSIGTWCGLESLCRWESPSFGRISPLVFIREAEQLGLMDCLGKWVLETAVRQCKALGLDRLEHFFLSVNLSPLQLLGNGLYEDVVDILRECGYPAEKLCLEVTESTRLVLNEHTRETIEKLRFRGVRISLDDFGTGYSSFDNLKNLPVSFLKTEGGFIRGIEEDNYMQYYYYILSELAHATDMKLIAEGVETREELEIVVKNGADYIQGYYFSRPMSAEDLARQLPRFTQVDPTFYTMVSGASNAEQVFGNQSSYVVTPRLFKMQNQCMQLLLSSFGMEKAFEKVLEIVGEHLHAGRAYLFQRTTDKNRKNDYINTHEWCASEVVSQKNIFLEQNLGEVADIWVSMMHADGIVVAADCSNLPGPLSRFMAAEGIKAVVALPMWDGDELIGFLGLDSHLVYREWMPEEIVTLQNLSMVMAACIKREQLQQKVVEKSKIMSDVLNSINISVWITDLETREILWANDSLRSLCAGGGPLEGRKCYEVLCGHETICSRCRTKELKQIVHGQQLIQEYYNPALKKTFITYDSLIEWEDKRLAHLEYLVDITRYKEVQNQLAHITGGPLGARVHRVLSEKFEAEHF